MKNELQILAGGFGKVTAWLQKDGILALVEEEVEHPLTTRKTRSMVRRLIVEYAEIDHVEIQTQETLKKLSGAAGWALAGSVLLGPLGLLAGAIWGGRHKKTCFAAYLKDGRKFLAVTDPKTFQRIQAVAF